MKRFSLYLMMAVFCVLAFEGRQNRMLADGGVLLRSGECVREWSDMRNVVADCAKALKESSLSLPCAFMARGFSNPQQSSFKSKTGNDGHRHGLLERVLQKNRHGGHILKSFLFVKSKMPVDYYVFALRRILI